MDWNKALSPTPLLLLPILFIPSILPFCQKGADFVHEVGVIPPFPP